MAFSLSRKEGFPSQFGELYPPVDIDVVEIGIITFGIILFSSLISITSINSRVYSYGIRLLISVFFGTIILFNNYGQKWEYNSIKTNVTSINKSINRTEIDVEIGIKIGLRSINVTLKSLEDKKIDYNEEFKWTWDQGIIGFGLHSGHLQQSFRKSQYRGLPIPILEVVDNLIIDGENFRYGRFYRNAGWYTHKLLNITFFIWVFAVFKFRALVMYKALIILSAGLLQIIASVVWCYIKNPIPLKIIFDNGQLVPKYGLNFWLNLFSGIFCTLLAIIIFIAYHWYQGPTVLFFGLDPLSEFEEEIHLCEIKNNEYNEMNEQGQKSLTNDIELNEITRMAKNSDIVEYHCLRERKKSFIRKRRYRNLVTNQNFSGSIRSGSTIQLIHT